MNIFPSSPVWANIERRPLWNEEVIWYDSGDSQGASPWARPLYEYAISARNFNEFKQGPLHSFWNTLKGKTTPFLFKDPYDYVTSAAVTQPTTTAMGNGSGFYIVQANSWRVLPDSAFLAIADARSGALVSSTHYVVSLFNGWVTTKVAVSSVWVASFQYFRKVRFNEQYGEVSKVWNIFDANLILREMPPS